MRPYCILAQLADEHGNVVAFGPYRSVQAAVAARRKQEKVRPEHRWLVMPLLDPRDLPKR